MVAFNKRKSLKKPWSYHCTENFKKCRKCVSEVIFSHRVIYSSGEAHLSHNKKQDFVIFCHMGGRIAPHSTQTHLTNKDFPFCFVLAWNAQSNKLMFSEDTCPSQHNRSMFHQFTNILMEVDFFSLFTLSWLKDFMGQEWKKKRRKKSFYETRPGKFRYIAQFRPVFPDYTRKSTRDCK